MNPSTGELAKRLRESCPATQDMASTEICDNYTEAADALEALAARLVAMEEVVKAADDMVRSFSGGNSYLNSLEAALAFYAARAKLEDRA